MRQIVTSSAKLANIPAIITRLKTQRPARLGQQLVAVPAGHGVKGIRNERIALHTLSNHAIAGALAG